MHLQYHHHKLGINSNWNPPLENMWFKWMRSKTEKSDLIGWNWNVSHRLLLTDSHFQGQENYGLEEKTHLDDPLVMLMQSMTSPHQCISLVKVLSYHHIPLVIVLWQQTSLFIILKMKWLEDVMIEFNLIDHWWAITWYVFINWWIYLFLSLTFWFSFRGGGSKFRTTALLAICYTLGIT